MPTATTKTITVETQTAFTYSTILAFIQSIADEVTARGGTWSVVDNDVVSTHGRQILLKSSDTDMANVKVAIFGGVSPHASAVASNASAAYVYVAVHTNHSSDTFDANFDAGAPLTGAGYVEGRSWWNSATHSTGTAIRIVRSGDMFALFAFISSTGLAFGGMIAGGIGRDEDGNLLYGCAGSGATAMTVQWSSSTDGLITGLLTAPGGSAGAALWLDSADTICGRAWTTISTTIVNSMTNGDGSKIWLTDIPIADGAGRIRGFWKQMRIGQEGKCFTTAIDQDTNQEFIRIAASLGATASEEALYFVQPAS